MVKFLARCLVGQHWYSFSFVGVTPAGDVTAGDAYIGMNKKHVTRWRIAQAKEVASVPDDSTLVSINYLGLMTRTEFLGKGHRRGAKRASRQG